MQKTIRELMEENDQKIWGPNMPERRQTAEKILPVQRLKLVRDGSIRYNAPKAPITSPEHCLEIFRAVFDGADKELVHIITLTMDNQYINCPLVAVGTIGHVVVHPREVFKYALGRDNATKIIMAHNHPSGDPEPSPEDFEMMEEIRDLGIRLGCRLIDFLILGDGNDSYYSHRELHYDYF